MSQLTFGEPFGDTPDTTTLVTSKPRVESWYKGRVLSHSSMSTYLTCPQKWKFRYIDKIPELPKPYFSFGKSVHAGLEFLFSRNHKSLPSLDELLAHFRQGWLSDGYETPAQEKWFFQEGDRILRGFFAKHQYEFKNVFQVELKFSFDVDGVPVMGYIDRIDMTPSGKLQIIDYKTGRAFDKARVRKDPQLTLYQMAVRELLGKEVEKLTLYHLNSLTPLTVPAHEAQLEQEVRANVATTARGITDGKFEPNVDERGHCQYCDYAQVCPGMVGKRKPSIRGNKEELSQMADRLGKLQAKVEELSLEKQQVAETLKGKMLQLGLEKVDGEFFSAEVAPSSDGGPASISSQMLKPPTA